MEFFEIIFNKDMYDGLADEQKAILRHAAKAASSDNFWKGLDRYSSDLQWIQSEGGVNVHRTDTSILQAQLKAWDQVLETLRAEDAFFKKVTDSQRAWAERVGYYLHSDQPDYVMAWEHYFGKLPS
jgi:TRAP-type mannitol/chloroaromatic compound transport system substrate-binding protein